MLGKQYSFGSSVGHIRDLPEKKYGIDLSGKDISVDYEVLPSKKQVVKDLIKEAKKAKVVYLCPDPDREGEAIAWHIRALLPKEVKTKRVTFNSITKTEVEKAIKEPRDIDMDLVDAQQARRILDRIVGYGVSPIIVQRVQLGRRGGAGALSAGRVQSVALKLVVDREKEIRAFQSEEYWNLFAHFIPQFKAQLTGVDGVKVVTSLQKKRSEKGKVIKTEKEALLLKKRLSSSKFHVRSISKSERLRHPVAPFITSTLQQEASRHYGFSAQRTMNIAQELYEGITLGSGGVEGLITYMRTDSVRISPDAMQAVRSYIPKTFGDSFLNKTARQFGKKKNTQDAHEAIRPATIEHTPDSIKKHLTTDQFKLYSLIWKRFVATQMSSAIYDTVQVEVDGQGLDLRATGSQIKFLGFLKLYQEKQDDSDGEDEASRLLPDLKEGQSLELSSCDAEQSFTKPPPRYSEASLVKALEESGIGRPSTYAAIMNKIHSRAYTVKEKGRLKPTLLGEVTTQLLESSFQQIMNLGFTAEMEDALEKVASSQLSWESLIRDFWKEFEPVLEEAKKSAHVPKTDTEYKCPSCKKDVLQKIWAGQNFFLGCKSYPDCEYRCGLEEYEFDKSPYSERFDWDQRCKKCGSEMKIRRGPYGVFLGCSDYPNCKSLVQIPMRGEGEQMAQKASCPAIGCEGTLSAKRSRFGKIFFSCSSYPGCDVIGSTLDEIEEKYQNHPMTEAKKKAKKNAKTSTKKASTKKKAPVKPKDPLKLSKELSAIVKEPVTTRGSLTKALWVYIKENKLQDPQDGRYILCDKALEPILGSGRVHMTAVAKALSHHIL